MDSGILPGVYNHIVIAVHFQKINSVCVSTCFILPSSWSGIVDPNLTLSYYSWVELAPKCSQASGPHCSVKSLGSREHGAAQILDQVTAR